MKRKETIAFINETVDFIVKSEVSVGVLDTKTGRMLKWRIRPNCRRSSP